MQCRFAFFFGWCRCMYLCDTKSLPSSLKCFVLMKNTIEIQFIIIIHVCVFVCLCFNLCLFLSARMPRSIWMMPCTARRTSRSSWRLRSGGTLSWWPRWRSWGQGWSSRRELRKLAEQGAGRSQRADAAPALSGQSPISKIVKKRHDLWPLVHLCLYLQQESQNAVAVVYAGGLYL